MWQKNHIYIALLTLEALLLYKTGFMFIAQYCSVYCTVYTYWIAQDRSLNRKEGIFFVLYFQSTWPDLAGQLFGCLMCRPTNCFTYLVGYQNNMSSVSLPTINNQTQKQVICVLMILLNLDFIGCSDFQNKLNANLCHVNGF